MKHLGKPFIFISLIIPVLLWYLSKSDPLVITDKPLIAATQVISLVGTMLLSWSYILASRTKGIEKLFGGLDKVYKMHTMTSEIGFLAILHHPLFLMLNALPNFTLVKMYFIPSTDISYTTGIIALAIYMVLVTLTIYVNMPYHIWKKLHEYMGVALLFTLAHVYLINSDISRFMPLRIYMLVFLGLAIVAYVYKKYLYFTFGPRFLYVVKKVVRNGEILDIYMSPVGKSMSFVSGQFVFMTLRGKGINNEDHPFSIASSSKDKDIRICTKILGDYTLTLRDLREGAEVILHGPFGAFGDRLLRSKKPAVFIGGGIGITPFLGMMREIKNITRLYYCCSTTEEAVFHDEIERDMAMHPQFSYQAIISKRDGRLTAHKIKEHVSDITNHLFFLCGPTPMMHGLTEHLAKLGVPRKNIIFEDFNFK